MRHPSPVHASYAVLLRTKGDPHELYRELDRRLEGRLAGLTLTNNRRTIVSIRPGKHLELRIHHCFTTAPAEVLDAAAAFVAGASGTERQRHLGSLRKFFAAHAGVDAPRGRRRPPRARPRGEHFDLEAIRDEVNERYFEGALRVPITWGRWPARRTRPRTRRRTIHLGTYSAEQNLIRIHPALDQPWVPQVVVASVVHHELLHAAMPAETVRGRRRLHPPEFRRRERLFVGFDEAEAWLAENLPRVLAARG